MYANILMKFTSIYSTLFVIALRVILQSFSAIVNFYIFYDGPVDIQMWSYMTLSQCRVSDTQVTVKACWPLVREHNGLFNSSVSGWCEHQCMQEDAHLNEQRKVHLHRSLQSWFISYVLILLISNIILSTINVSFFWYLSICKFLLFLFGYWNFFCQTWIYSVELAWFHCCFSREVILFYV